MSPINLEVVVASRWYQRIRGLSFKNSIPHDGLLFQFARAACPAFWMWGMRLAIDILWIAGGRIVGREEYLHPPRYRAHILFPYFLKRYRPGLPIDAALEVRAGFCRAQGLDAGADLRMEHC